MTSKFLAKLDRYIKIFQENDTKDGDIEFCATTIILMDCKQEIQRLRAALKATDNPPKGWVGEFGSYPNYVTHIVRQALQETTNKE